MEATAITAYLDSLTHFESLSEPAQPERGGMQPMFGLCACAKDLSICFVCKMPAVLATVQPSPALPKQLGSA